MAPKRLVEAVRERLGHHAPLEPQTLETILETLSEMGLLTAAQPPQTAGSDDPAWAMSFPTYLSLGDQERRALLLAVQERNRPWIAQQLTAHRAAWILVCGGTVIESSADLNEYPSPQRLMQVGHDSNRIPFVFCRPPVFEESPWVVVDRNDCSPTLALWVGAGEWDHPTLLAQGRPLTADCDTGSPSLFVSWEWLLAEELVVPTPVDFPQAWHHVGRQYAYDTRSLRVGVTDEGGTMRSLPIVCECVEDWHQRPLCEVNPARLALAGRNVLLMFPLTVELNGSARTTRVLSL
jgi:hypothetical protein